MKNIIICLICLFFSGISIAQDSQVIMSIENEDVSLSDFESIFRKNNKDTLITADDLDEYMELFINFKLKVQEAKSLGMDTISSFTKELEGYRKQLARPYLTDSEMLDKLIEEAYERKQFEVKASHILINCNPLSTPEDTLKAYNKIMDIRDGVIGGDDFETVAKKVSDDPSTADNNGDLGYFTAFQMVYPFEQAAFNTNVGEVSMPVRTRFGYHILYVADKRAARGEIRCAHIMVRPKAKNIPEERANAELKIKDIYAQLQQGEDFASMAQKYSEDATTNNRGGELPWFGTGKMVTEFEDAAFALANDGDYTEPFESEYGWHICKRLEYRPVPSFDEMRKELKSKVSRDSRSEVTKASFLEKLKKEYSFAANEKIQKKIRKCLDTASNTVNLKQKLRMKPFITMDGKTWNSEEWIANLEAKIGKRRALSIDEFIAQEWTSFSEKMIMDYENGKLEEKHDAFRLLMNEYRDGILLFELTDEKVWSKAVKDTTGLEAYYEKNKTNFMWDTRVNATIYTCKDKKISDKVLKELNRGKSTAEISEKINRDSQLNLQVKSGQFLKDAETILSKVEWKVGISEAVFMNDQYFIVNIEEVIAPEPKKLDECRGLVTAEYQNFLEQQWIDELRGKYTYNVNREILHSLAD